jgi:hypothetical protein
MAEYAEGGLVVRTGSLEIDVPRSFGFFGGIAAGVALGLLEPPLALFIAAVPFVKMLSDQRAPIPVRSSHGRSSESHGAGSPRMTLLAQESVANTR